MRVVVLGGTRFIGRAIVAALVADGHAVMVCHRGGTEPADLPDVAHLHSDRSGLGGRAGELGEFRPEGVVDCMALSATDMRAGFDAFGAFRAFGGEALRWVVLSSMDVYRAFACLQHEVVAEDSLPITEDSPVRADRYPYPDVAGRADYSKLDVEDVALARGAVVLRLPMVYGPHDYQRREEFVLRRVRAGRRRIPIGAAAGILPFAFVDDVARGVAAALVAPGGHVEGEVFNLAEAEMDPVAVWMRRILQAAGSEGELTRVPDALLPPDMDLAGSQTQPMVVSAAKARRVLGYVDTPRPDAVVASVVWHLAHPPADPDPDFSADDRALTSA